MHACKNNITSPPDCVEGATAQIKKNLLLPPMHNGLAVEDLCSVPDLHFDPLQMGREPALSSVDLSLSTRAALGRAHVVASNCPIGAGVDTAERGLEVPVRRWKGADGDSSHTCAPLRQSMVASAALSCVV